LVYLVVLKELVFEEAKEKEHPGILDIIENLISIENDLSQQIE